MSLSALVSFHPTEEPLEYIRNFNRLLKRLPTRRTDLFILVISASLEAATPLALYAAIRSCEEVLVCAVFFTDVLLAVKLADSKKGILP